MFAIWIVAIFGAMAANLPGKFSDAEDNESTSFLPGDAESTKALTATEDLQGGELAPAVIVFRRDSGLTAADRQTIQKDVAKLAQKRFPGVVADGATAAAGGKATSDAGALAARVTGSGPTTFGIFATPERAERAAERLGEEAMVAEVRR